MRQPCSEMVACAVKKNLCFVLEAAKRARMDDARPIALKLCAISVTWLGIFSAARFAGFLREGRERRSLGFFHLRARFPTVACAVLHSSIVDFGESGFFAPDNSGRKSFSAFRASARTTTKSNKASRIAVTVSQPHTSQSKI